MSPLQEIRKSLDVYDRVSFDPIIRKLVEVVRVVQPDPAEPLTPQVCIRALRKMEEACKKAASEGNNLVDTLEEGGYDADLASKLISLLENDYIPIEEYTDPQDGLMYSLQEQFLEISEKLSRQYRLIEEALDRYEEENSG